MPVSAALDARGLKRVCVSCGIRFYDFNKRPIHCPNCATEFSGEIKLKGRRGRVAALEEEKPVKAVTPVANDDQNSDVEARDEGIVSLEDVEALENAGAEDTDEDAALEDDDDLTTLEDIEEDEDLAVPVEDKKE
jgi:uncharacterized protein (TIGR02300 family)